MISINNVTVQFGGFELFKDISFIISQKERIGLVGKNGAGKTTLLKIILGEQAPTKGNVSLPSDATFGYLPQEMNFINERNLFDETMTAFKEVIHLEKRMEEINNDLSNRTDYESDQYLEILNMLTEATQRYNLLGGATIEADIEQTLTGLGFLQSDFKRPTIEFSGGWRMRIELAKILLKRPDVLLLDEPTNHLDIESIQWLEDFLQSYHGAVVLISHDRAFLDNVTKRTVEILLGNVYDYKVSYSKYVELRKERREQQMAAYRNQQKFIEETERFVERFRYKATKANQVQSRVKQLDKLVRIEVDDEDTSSMHFRFPPAPRGGAIVVEAEGLSKSYGSHLVLNNIDLIIERGEKVAFVGKNGEGKTTLSRIIIDELEYNGNLKVGHNIKIGYYAQNQDELLNGEKTVYQTLDDIAIGDVRTQLRSILGSFLFSGEDVDKKVKVLSGGERSRLALASLLLEPFNLLVLDEPTNHLDMRSKDILKQALQKYDGAIILVSHDRHFLDGLVNKVFEFKDKKIKESIGGIYDFLQKKRINSLQELEKKTKTAKEQKAGKSSANKKQYEDRKELERDIRKVRNQIEKSESMISELEGKIKQIDELLINPDPLIIELNYTDIYKEYEDLKKELEKTMRKWEQQNYELEILDERKSDMT